MFQVGNQFCHFWTKEQRGDLKKKKSKPNTPKPKLFPLNLFLLTFVSAPQKPLGSVKCLLGRHILDRRKIKAKNLLDNMFVLCRTREGPIWCCLLFLFLFGVILSEQSSSKDQDCHMHFTWLPHTVGGLFPSHLGIKTLQLL